MDLSYHLVGHQDSDNTFFFVFVYTSSMAHPGGGEPLPFGLASSLSLTADQSHTGGFQPRGGYRTKKESPPAMVEESLYLSAHHPLQAMDEED